MTEPYDTLLAVQEHDTTVDQLKHRRANLAERAQLADVEARAQNLSARLADIAAQRDDAARRQSDLEADIAASEQRIRQLDARMYSGEVTASRDLQAITDEINSLKRRISGLEDRALEVMEEREPLEAQVSELEAETAALESEAAALRDAIAAAELEIDEEISSEEGRRSAVATQVPPALLTTYDKLRQRLGGVGAARFEHGTCMGCHLALPATEVDRLKKLPPEELVHCEQCGRILVR